MSRYYGPSGAGELQQYGLRFLYEQLGHEAIDSPNNQIYRIPDGYNAPLGLLWLFRNGLIQDITTGDYAENDDRTVIFTPNLAAMDRIKAIGIVDDRDYGGMLCVDRPPGNVGLLYTLTQNYNAGFELFVWQNGLKLIETSHYTLNPPNQFSLLALPPPGSTIVASIVTQGNEGMQWRETYTGMGAFPAMVPTVATIDKHKDEILVFINGQLQAENFDYEVLSTGINVTRAIVGPNDIEIIAIKACHPGQWRT